MTRAKRINQKDVVQLEGERVKKGGERRLSLNEKERAILRERAQAAQAISLFTSGLNLREVAEEMKIPYDQLTKLLFDKDHREFLEAVCDRAIGMFLDLEAGHSRSEIVESVGLTTWLFNKMLASDVFEERYSEQFGNLKADPVLQVVQRSIVQDLLPEALRTMRQIMLNPNAPANARMRAAIEVMNRSGVKAVQPEMSDRQELVKFLAERNITINNNTLNVSVSPEYVEAVKKYLLTDEVESEIVDSQV